MEFRSTTRPDRHFIHLLRATLDLSAPHCANVHQSYIFNRRWLFSYYLHDEVASRKHLRKLCFCSSGEVIENVCTLIFFFFSPCTYAASAGNKSIWTCKMDEVRFCILWNQTQKNKLPLKWRHWRPLKMLSTQKSNDQCVDWQWQRPPPQFLMACLINCIDIATLFTCIHWWESFVWVLFKLNQDLWWHLPALFSALTGSLCVFCRQHLTPCEAELTLSGHDKIKSNTSNYWVGHMIEVTNRIFTGGLPQDYLPNQVSFWPSLVSALWKSYQSDNHECFFLSQRAKPFHNYTGCFQIIEINNRRDFHASDAIGGTNVGRCRWDLPGCFCPVT